MNPISRASQAALGADAPRVSVLMPSLNQAAFIAVAIESVLLHQGPTPLELIVADGGSRDGTLDILTALTERFGADRLRWVSGPDGGPADAVNRALALARGPVIGWLNSDDQYTPGAVAHALGLLLTHPEWEMVYGEGEHIDPAGQRLGRYPTLPPSAGLDAFQSGCYICQPTVFLRREVFIALGGLDTALGTAFDFDLWLRLFTHFPGRVGHTHRVQARSRLHPQGITARLRRQAVAEGVRVLARHLGRADPHWLRTWRDELLADLLARRAGSRTDPRADLLALVDELSGCFAADAELALRAEFDTDPRLRWAEVGLASNAWIDGWAPQRLELTALSLPAAGGNLVLKGEPGWPTALPLRLQVSASWGLQFAQSVKPTGPFTLRLAFPPVAAGRPARAVVSCNRFFSPAAQVPGSTDDRHLAWRLRSLAVETPDSAPTEPIPASQDAALPVMR